MAHFRGRKPWARASAFLVLFGTIFCTALPAETDKHASTSGKGDGKLRLTAWNGATATVDETVYAMTGRKTPFLETAGLPQAVFADVVKHHQKLLRQALAELQRDPPNGSAAKALLDFFGEGYLSSIRPSVGGVELVRALQRTSLSADALVFLRREIEKAILFDFREAVDASPLRPVENALTLEQAALLDLARQRPPEWKHLIAKGKETLGTLPVELPFSRLSQSERRILRHWLVDGYRPGNTPANHARALLFFALEYAERPAFPATVLALAQREIEAARNAPPPTTRTTPATTSAPSSVLKTTADVVALLKNISGTKADLSKVKLVPASPGEQEKLRTFLYDALDAAGFPWPPGQGHVRSGLHGKELDALALWHLDVGERHRTQQTIIALLALRPSYPVAPRYPTIAEPPTIAALKKSIADADARTRAWLRLIASPSVTRAAVVAAGLDEVSRYFEGRTLADVFGPHAGTISDDERRHLVRIVRDAHRTFAIAARAAFEKLPQATRPASVEALHSLDSAYLDHWSQAAPGAFAAKVRETLAAAPGPGDLAVEHARAMERHLAFHQPPFSPPPDAKTSYALVREHDAGWKTAPPFLVAIADSWRRRCESLPSMPWRSWAPLAKLDDAHRDLLTGTAGNFTCDAAAALLLRAVKPVEIVLAALSTDTPREKLFPLLARVVPTLGTPHTPEGLDALGFLPRETLRYRLLDRLRALAGSRPVTALLHAPGGSEALAALFFLRWLERARGEYDSAAWELTTLLRDVSPHGEPRFPEVPPSRKLTFELVAEAESWRLATEARRAMVKSTLAVHGPLPPSLRADLVSTKAGITTEDLAALAALHRSAPDIARGIVRHIGRGAVADYETFSDELRYHGRLHVAFRYYENDDVAEPGQLAPVNVALAKEMLARLLRNQPPLSPRHLVALFDGGYYHLSRFGETLANRYQRLGKGALFLDSPAAPAELARLADELRRDIELRFFLDARASERELVKGVGSVFPAGLPGAPPFGKLAFALLPDAERPTPDSSKVAAVLDFFERQNGHPAAGLVAAASTQLELTKQAIDADFAGETRKRVDAELLARLGRLNIEVAVFHEAPPGADADNALLKARAIQEEERKTIGTYLFSKRCGLGVSPGKKVDLVVHRSVTGFSFKKQHFHQALVFRVPSHVDGGDAKLGEALARELEADGARFERAKENFYERLMDTGTDAEYGHVVYQEPFRYKLPVGLRDLFAWKLQGLSAEHAADTILYALHWVNTRDDTHEHGKYFAYREAVNVVARDVFSLVSPKDGSARVDLPIPTHLAAKANEWQSRFQDAEGALETATSPAAYAVALRFLRDPLGRDAAPAIQATAYMEDLLGEIRAMAANAPDDFERLLQASETLPPGHRLRRALWLGAYPPGARELFSGAAFKKAFAQFPGRLCAHLWAHDARVPRPGPEDFSEEVSRFLAQALPRQPEDPRDIGDAGTGGPPTPLVDEAIREIVKERDPLVRKAKLTAPPGWEKSLRGDGVSFDARVAHWKDLALKRDELVDELARVEALLKGGRAAPSPLVRALLDDAAHLNHHGNRLHVIREALSSMLGHIDDKMANGHPTLAKRFAKSLEDPSCRVGAEEAAKLPRNTRDSLGVYEKFLAECHDISSLDWKGAGVGAPKPRAPLFTEDKFFGIWHKPSGFNGIANSVVKDFRPVPPPLPSGGHYADNPQQQWMAGLPAASQVRLARLPPVVRGALDFLLKASTATVPVGNSRRCVTGVAGTMTKLELAALILNPSPAAIFQAIYASPSLRDGYLETLAPSPALADHWYRSGLTPEFLREHFDVTVDPKLDERSFTGPVYADFHMPFGSFRITPKNQSATPQWLAAEAFRGVRARELAPYEKILERLAADPQKHAAEIEGTKQAIAEKSAELDVLQAYLVSRCQTMEPILWQLEPFAKIIHRDEYLKKLRAEADSGKVEAHFAKYVEDRLDGEGKVPPWVKAHVDLHLPAYKMAWSAKVAWQEKNLPTTLPPIPKDEESDALNYLDIPGVPHKSWRALLKNVATLAPSEVEAVRAFVGKRLARNPSSAALVLMALLPDALTLSPKHHAECSALDASRFDGVALRKHLGAPSGDRATFETQLRDYLSRKTGVHAAGDVKLPKDWAEPLATLPAPLREKVGKLVLSVAGNPDPLLRKLPLHWDRGELSSLTEQQRQEVERIATTVPITAVNRKADRDAALAQFAALRLPSGVTEYLEKRLEDPASYGKVGNDWIPKLLLPNGWDRPFRLLTDGQRAHVESIVRLLSTQPSRNPQGLPVEWATRFAKLSDDDKRSLQRLETLLTERLPKQGVTGTVEIFDLLARELDHDAIQGALRAFDGAYQHYFIAKHKAGVVAEKLRQKILADGKLGEKEWSELVFAAKAALAEKGRELLRQLQPGVSPKEDEEELERTWASFSGPDAERTDKELRVEYEKFRKCYLAPHDCIPSTGTVPELRERLANERPLLFGILGIERKLRLEALQMFVEKKSAAGAKEGTIHWNAVTGHFLGKEIPKNEHYEATIPIVAKIEKILDGAAPPPGATLGFLGMSPHAGNVRAAVTGPDWRKTYCGKVDVQAFARDAWSDFRKASDVAKTQERGANGFVAACMKEFLAKKGAIDRELSYELGEALRPLHVARLKLHDSKQLVSSTELLVKIYQPTETFQAHEAEIEAARKAGTLGNGARLALQERESADLRKEGLMRSETLLKKYLAQRHQHDNEVKLALRSFELVQKRIDDETTRRLAEQGKLLLDCKEKAKSAPSPIPEQIVGDAFKKKSPDYSRAPEHIRPAYLDLHKDFASRYIRLGERGLALARLLAKEGKTGDAATADPLFLGWSDDVARELCGGAPAALRDSFLARLKADGDAERAREAKLGALAERLSKKWGLKLRGDEKHLVLDKMTATLFAGSADELKRDLDELTELAEERQLAAMQDRGDVHLGFRVDYWAQLRDQLLVEWVQTSNSNAFMFTTRTAAKVTWDPAARDIRFAFHELAPLQREVAYVFAAIEKELSEHAKFYHDARSAEDLWPFQKRENFISLVMKGNPLPALGIGKSERALEDVALAAHRKRLAVLLDRLPAYGVLSGGAEAPLAASDGYTSYKTTLEEKLRFDHLRHGFHLHEDRVSRQWQSGTVAVAIAVSLVPGGQGVSGLLLATVQGAAHGILFHHMQQTGMNLMHDLTGQGSRSGVGQGGTASLKTALLFAANGPVIRGLRFGATRQALLARSEQQALRYSAFAGAVSEPLGMGVVAYGVDRFWYQFYDEKKADDAHAEALHSALVMASMGVRVPGLHKAWTGRAGFFAKGAGQMMVMDQAILAYETLYGPQSDERLAELGTEVWKGKHPLVAYGEKAGATARDNVGIYLFTGTTSYWHRNAALAALDMERIGQPLQPQDAQRLRALGWPEPRGRDGAPPILTLPMVARLHGNHTLSLTVQFLHDYGVEFRAENAAETRQAALATRRLVLEYLGSMGYHDLMTRLLQPEFSRHLAQLLGVRETRLREELRRYGNLHPSGPGPVPAGPERPSTATALREILTACGDSARRELQAEYERLLESDADSPDYRRRDALAYELAALGRDEWMLFLGPAELARFGNAPTPALHGRAIVLLSEMMRFEASDFTAFLRSPPTPFRHDATWRDAILAYLQTRQRLTAESEAPPAAGAVPPGLAGPTPLLLPPPTAP